jgi:tetrahydromethanopterin S-methyltransferase subunit G
LPFVEEYINENSLDDLEDLIDEIERYVERIVARLSRACRVERDIGGILDLREAVEYYMEEVLE